jgi:hypothetical protein
MRRTTKDGGTKRKYRNLHATDLELVVEEAHPQIRRAGVAAFSVDDGEKERLTVLVEVPTVDAVALAEIAASIQRRVADELAVRLDDVVFVPLRQIPRTTSGKIERSRAKAQFLTRQIDLVRPPLRASFDRLQSAVDTDAIRLNCRRMKLDSSATTFGAQGPSLAIRYRPATKSRAATDDAA